MTLVTNNPLKKSNFEIKKISCTTLTSKIYVWCNSILKENVIFPHVDISVKIIMKCTKILV